MHRIAVSSRPVWGAWIEMHRCLVFQALLKSRPVWGAWIEIPAWTGVLALTDRRAPYGARGLKCVVCPVVYGRLKVAPRMGRVD